VLPISSLDRACLLLSFHQPARVDQDSITRRKITFIHVGAVATKIWEQKYSSLVHVSQQYVLLHLYPTTYIICMFIEHVYYANPNRMINQTDLDIVLYYFPVGRTELHHSNVIHFKTNSSSFIHTKSIENVLLWLVNQQCKKRYQISKN